ncbi:hypothetical protein [Wenjunlia tyrosinilytica]|uniref:Uncharacterized protein n=1 Tax=Wenjunlia tyrosinilytica TaxID=1544741 RepID=A0A917ZXJ0_9ACTN|nr:hypothetical protein [Wenjunlia tyrosinilytica]GGP00374.1 hypothetical protein GCM10012280_69000 [Wenjunlia tyrosinilytica]
MPENPIPERELAALTRRMEEMEQRLTGLIQTNGIQLAMTLGERLAAQEARITSRIEELKQHIDHRNAEIIEALSGRVGQNPDQ